LIEASGVVHTGEASRIAAAVAKRQRGSSAIFYVVQIALMGGGVLLGLVFSALASVFGHLRTDQTWWWPFVGLGVGGFVYSSICRRMVVRRFRSKMAEAGLAVDFRSFAAIGDEALEVEAHGVRRIVSWPAVTELFATADYWIFMIAMEPWFVPKRFFSSPVEEKAFVSAAVGRMSAEARARSPDAVAAASA
jgi:hypothetical protein